MKNTAGIVIVCLLCVCLGLAIYILVSNGGTSDCTSNCTSDSTSDSTSDCTSNCTSNCTSDCTSNCTSDCTSNCTSDCMNNCTSDCTSNCTSNCTRDYFAVNTFDESPDGLKVLCYSEDPTCDIYYYEPGNVSEFANVFTVNAGKAIEIDLTEFAIGGILKSANQFDVTIEGTNGVGFLKDIAKLPGATDAGTKFAPHFSFRYLPATPITDKCIIYALAKHVELVFQYADNNLETVLIEANQILHKNIDFKGDQSLTLRVTATAPVIISCFSGSDGGFYTWQSIVSEPIFVYLNNYSEHLSLSLSDCETNAAINDYRRVKFEYGTLSSGSCSMIQSISSDGYVLGKGGIDCVVLVIPLDDRICVSVMEYYVAPSSAPNYSWRMMPSKSKLPMKLGFVGPPSELSVDMFVFSFEPAKCNYSTDNSDEFEATLLDASGQFQALETSFYFEELNKTISGDILMECTGPVFVVDTLKYWIALEVLGYHSEDHWKPLTNDDCFFPDN